MKQMWKAFVSSHIAVSSRPESELALQLLFDRLLKRLLHNKAIAKKRSTAGTPVDSVRPLTMMESNAVRYMSGFVAVSLLKKYRRPTKHGELKVKWALFVRVLSKMKAVDQPGEPESALDYTRLWSDLIGRGGLYHINDEVYQLMESIELLTRRHLNVESVQVLTPGTNICKLIMEDVIRSGPILSRWETIAHNIPTKYEPYSIDLLQVITDLWITVRGHSFAKDWTMKFVSKYKKGTRKTLKEKQ